MAAILSAAFLFTAAHESEARGGKMGGRTNSIITQTNGGSGANKPIIRDHRGLGRHRCHQHPEHWACRRIP
jgi:hypothetical protein